MDQVIDFSYLAPLPAAHQIVHQVFNIKKNEGVKGVRKIYENVQYDSFENQKIKEIEKECVNQNILIPNDWKKSDFLKMQYSGKFILKDSMKKLTMHLEWKLNDFNHSLNEMSLQFLKQGILYTHGRDKQYRPIIILNAYLIDLKRVLIYYVINTKHTKDQIVQSLSFFMRIVKTHMMVAGKVENWIFILDTNKLGVFGLPLNALGVIIDCMSVNFCGCLDKMYILNPSSALNFTWNAITRFIDSNTKDKINFISSKNIDQMKERIDPDQLEKKYGGTREDLKLFWPPINLDLQTGYPQPKILDNIINNTSHFIDQQKSLGQKQQNDHQQNDFQEEKINLQDVKSQFNEILINHSNQNNQQFTFSDLNQNKSSSISPTGVFKKFTFGNNQSILKQSTNQLENKLEYSSNENIEQQEIEQFVSTQAQNYIIQLQNDESAPQINPQEFIQDRISIESDQMDSSIIIIPQKSLKSIRDQMDLIKTSPQKSLKIITDQIDVIYEEQYSIDEEDKTYLKQKLQIEGDNIIVNKGCCSKICNIF